MRYLDELSRQLSRQADDECQRRQAAEPLEQRKRRAEGMARLRDAVIRAAQNQNPAEAERLWAIVDGMVFGSGAAE